jgi:hypothetical protein
LLLCVCVCVSVRLLVYVIYEVKFGDPFSLLYLKSFFLELSEQYPV